MINGDYILVKAPDDYPGKRYRGRYIYEHHLNWWKANNYPVPSGYVIHHKNHDKHDNNINNLELISAATHSKMHREPAEKIGVTCAYCRNAFIKLKRYIVNKKKHGQERFYCCRSHQVIDQQRMIKEKSLVA